MEIKSADDIVAVRNDKVELVCHASNDSPANETYTLGGAIIDEATVDVYCKWIYIFMLLKRNI